jgi:hypothetical protein
MAAAAELYELGDQVGLSVQFGSPKKPIDPARVHVRVRDPEGRTAELTYGKDQSVVRTAPGEYQVVIVATLPGRWRYRFVGLGRVRGEHDGFFDVFDLSAD